MHPGNVSDARLLWRGAVESDPAFAAEIARGSLLSLRVVSALLIVIPLFLMAAGLSVIPIPLAGGGTATPNLALAALGTLGLLVAWTPPGRRWPRTVTAIIIWSSVAVMVWAALRFGSNVPWIEHHLLGYMLFVMFGSAAAVPFTPLHTLILGAAIEAVYLAAPGLGINPLQHGVIAAITLLGAALTASVYRQRYAGYRLHRQALETSERLRRTENRLLVSENAAVLGRVAAALSHELNSPIGVLASTVDSLAHIAAKAPTAPPAEQERLRAVAADLIRSGRESATRLRTIVGRMQRFTNLDRAEVQSADLNEILKDVIALIGSDNPHAPVEAEFGIIPRFICRPQQMSAVFSNLIANAIDAVRDGNGTVHVATLSDKGRIEIRVEDNGRGIPPEDLATLFDPAAFRVTQGRVSASNWSLFSCRQIVQEHGGDIEASSGDAKGTRVRVLLPVSD
jgi:signal transduction histidine kinase